MRIGVDIDGVLTDVEQWILDYGSKFYFEKYNIKITNPKSYESKDIFDVSNEYDDEFWDKYFIEYSKNVEVRKFASEVISKLREEQNEIYIITARGSFLPNLDDKFSFEDNKKIVLEWLKNNEIKYDKIIFSPEEKLNICIENKIDVMIEDKPQNIKEISTKIPVICFNAGYNEKCDGDNITRCYTWYDIYSKLCHQK